MVTRRAAAAMRVAETDQENTAAVQPACRDAVRVPAKQTALQTKQAALQTKASKRNALGDKNVNQNAKHSAEGANAKPAAKVTGGCAPIPVIPVKPKDKAVVAAQSSKPQVVKAVAGKATKSVADHTARIATAAKAPGLRKDVYENHSREIVSVEVEETSAAIVPTAAAVAAAQGKARATMKRTAATTETTCKLKSLVIKESKQTSHVVDSKQITDQHSDDLKAKSGTSLVLSPMGFDGNLKLELSEEDLLFIEEQRKEDAQEPSLVLEYSEDIFRYMRELEVRMMPDPCYMDNQTEIQWEMRSILIDWLVEVHDRFQMQNETLFLCVNYIDRFLSAKVVSTQKLQLVGVTALLLAAKFEEISAPSIADLVYMVDRGYDAEEIKKAERYMVQLLNFELGYPGPMSFLRRISKADDYCQSTRTLAKYLIELTIMDENFIGIPPSMIAAAGDMLARKFLKGSNGSWTPIHVHYSGYTAEQLEDVAALIIERAMDTKTHASIYAKYAESRYWKASVYVQQWFEKYGYQEEYFFDR